MTGDTIQGLYRISELELGDVLEVETRNSVYKLRIVPFRSGNEYPDQRRAELIEPVRNIQAGELVTIYGSTNGASDRDRGELIQGRLLELFFPNRDMDYCTSTMVHLAINGEKIF